MNPKFDRSLTWNTSRLFCFSAREIAAICRVIFRVHGVIPTAMRNRVHGPENAPHGHYPVRPTTIRNTRSLSL